MDDKTIAGSFSFYKMSEKKRRKKSLIFLIHLYLTQFIRAGGVEFYSHGWSGLAKSEVYDVRCGIADGYHYTLYRVDVSTLLNDLRRWFANDTTTHNEITIWIWQLE